MPLCAAPDLPCAVICQLWSGVPIAAVATRTSVVGTFHVTSPTSVEPISTAPPGRMGTTQSHSTASRAGGGHHRPFGGDVLRAEGLLDARGIGTVQIVERHAAQLVQCLLHDAVHGQVLEMVRDGGEHLVFDGGLGHQRRPFGHLLHPLDQRQHLKELQRPDRVADACAGLDDVRRLAAGVKIGVMDARVLHHVLAQVVDADRHQLHRI